MLKLIPIPEFYKIPTTVHTWFPAAVNDHINIRLAYVCPLKSFNDTLEVIIPKPEGALLKSIHVQPTQEYWLVDLVFETKIDYTNKIIESLKEWIERKIEEKLILEYSLPDPLYEKIYTTSFAKGFVKPDGEPVIILSEKELEAIFLEMIKDYGEGGKLILRKLGENIGRKLMKSLWDYVEHKDTNYILSMPLKLLESQGQFIIKKLVTKKHGNETRLSLTLQDQIEEIVYWKNNVQPCSSVFEGVLRGILQLLVEKNRIKKDFVIKEEKCFDKNSRVSSFLILYREGD